MLYTKKKSLCEEIRTDVPGAFEEFVDLIQSSLLWYCLSRIKDYSEAENIAQEALTRLYENRKKIKKNCSGLLFRIAINLMNDYQTKKNRLKLVPHVREDDDDDTGESIIDYVDQINDTPETLFTEKQRSDAVNHIISTLKPECKDLINLVHFEGHSYKETGQILGIKESFVKKRLYRCIQKFRETFNKISGGKHEL